MKLETLYKIYGTITVLLLGFVFPDNNLLKIVMYVSLIVYFLIPQKWWGKWDERIRSKNLKALKAQ